jgi:ATP-dependent Lon protease
MKLALHDAQSVIAREYGFASFAELRERVERGEMLEALLQPHMSAPPPDGVKRALLAAMGEEPRPVELASPLPVLPVRNAVLTVGTVAPLMIGRPASLAALDGIAVRPDALCAIFPQKDHTEERPDEDGLHAHGCAAQLLHVEPGEGARWIVVRATHWIVRGALESRDPYLSARVSLFTIAPDDSDEVKRLEIELRAETRAFAAKMPQPAHLLKMIERMTALQLADATVANLPRTADQKARYTSEPRLRERLRFVTDLLRGG